MSRRGYLEVPSVQSSMCKSVVFKTIYSSIFWKTRWRTISFFFVEMKILWTSGLQNKGEMSVPSQTSHNFGGFFKLTISKMIQFWFLLCKSSSKPLSMSIKEHSNQAESDLSLRFWDVHSNSKYWSVFYFTVSVCIRLNGCFRYCAKEADTGTLKFLFFLSGKTTSSCVLQNCWKK